ncbi:MAG TPA: YihY/virulence factor BrkB family protein [Streptosporangiaceae bacterium]|nr:YihY/virulence factor BrkB family protein [Streptosporangiaceae bacterium]
MAINAVHRAVRAADDLQQRHAWLAVPVAVWKKFGDDQAGNLAALIAYYAFVAIFPLLLVLVTVLDIVLRNDAGLRLRVLNAALTQYPVVGADLVHSIGRLHGTGFALVIGLLGTFIGARGVASALQNALNSAWEIPFDRRPGFPWSWLRSFAMMFVIGVGFIVTTSLTTLAGGAGRVLPGFGAHVLAVVVSLALNFGLFWLGFRLGTAREVTWKQLRLGAVMSAVVWQVLQTFGGYFLSHQLAHASPLYGTFALVLGLVAWFYLQAELTLYAVEINVVRAYRLWPRSVAPPPYTEQDHRAYQLYAKVEQRHKDMDIMVGVTRAGGEDDRKTTPG